MTDRNERSKSGEGEGERLANGSSHSADSDDEALLSSGTVWYLVALALVAWPLYRIASRLRDVLTPVLVAQAIPTIAVVGVSVVIAFVLPAIVYWTVRSGGWLNHIDRGQP
jgi:hypothetical protein